MRLALVAKRTPPVVFTAPERTKDWSLCTACLLSGGGPPIVDWELGWNAGIVDKGACYDDGRRRSQSLEERTQRLAGENKGGNGKDG